MVLFLGEQAFFLLGARAGHAHDQVIQYRQEESEEKDAEKQFRLPVNEEEENHGNSNCDNCIVPNKRSNDIHKPYQTVPPSPSPLPGLEKGE